MHKSRPRRERAPIPRSMWVGVAWGSLFVANAVERVARLVGGRLSRSSERHAGFVRVARAHARLAELGRGLTGRLRGIAPEQRTRGEEPDGSKTDHEFSGRAGHGGSVARSEEAGEHGYDPRLLTRGVHTARAAFVIGGELFKPHHAPARRGERRDRVRRSVSSTDGDHGRATKWTRRPLASPLHRFPRIRRTMARASRARAISARTAFARSELTRASSATSSSESHTVTRVSPFARRCAFVCVGPLGFGFLSDTDRSFQFQIVDRFHGGDVHGSERVRVQPRHFFGGPYEHSAGHFERGREPR